MKFKTIHVLRIPYINFVNHGTNQFGSALALLKIMCVWMNGDAGYSSGYFFNCLNKFDFDLHHNPSGDWRPFYRISLNRVMWFRCSELLVILRDDWLHMLRYCGHSTSIHCSPADMNTPQQTSFLLLSKCPPASGKGNCSR
jgi:hypothetical protein